MEKTPRPPKNAPIPPRESERKTPLAVAEKHPSHKSRLRPVAWRPSPSAGQATRLRKPARWLGLTNANFDSKPSVPVANACKRPRDTTARPLRGSAARRSFLALRDAATIAVAATAAVQVRALAASRAVAGGSRESALGAGYNPSGLSALSSVAADFGERSRTRNGDKGTS